MITVGQTWKIRGSGKILTILAVNALGNTPIVAQIIEGQAHCYNRSWLLEFCVLEVRMPDESVLPPWVVGYCKDKDGKWYMYAKKPTCGEAAWTFSPGRYMRIPTAYCPVGSIDWHDSWVDTGCQLSAVSNTGLMTATELNERYTPETALELSIEKWERIQQTPMERITPNDLGGDTCALCRKHYICEGCPLASCSTGSLWAACSLSLGDEGKFRHACTLLLDALKG